MTSTERNSFKKELSKHADTFNQYESKLTSLFESNPQGFTDKQSDIDNVKGSLLTSMTSSTA